MRLLKYALGCAAMLATASSAFGTVITFNFANGTGTAGGAITGLVYPGSSGSDGNSTGINLGTSTMNLTDDGGVNVALILSGSAGLYCVASTATPANCAASASVNAPGNNGHAAGIGVGTDVRLNGAETISLAVQPGYTVTLISFVLTALYDETGEEMQYAVNGGGGIILDATSSALDAYDPSDTPFTNLVFSVPPYTGEGAGGAGNTYALYSITLDIVGPPGNTEVPEPASMGLVGAGLVALGLIARKRT